jgi:hypothetical protein
MEASDITGELHIALQIIATADAEYKATEAVSLQRNN